MNMLFVLLRTVIHVNYYKIILSIHVINMNMLFVLLRTVQLLQNNTVYSCDKHEYAVYVIKDSSIITK